MMTESPRLEQQHLTRCHPSDDRIHGWSRRLTSSCFAQRTAERGNQAGRALVDRTEMLGQEQFWKNILFLITQAKEVLSSAKESLNTPIEN